MFEKVTLLKCVAGHNMNLRKILFLLNETLYGALIGGRRKRPTNLKQKIWPFWPNFGQIQQSSALNV